MDLREFLLVFAPLFPTFQIHYGFIADFVENMDWITMKHVRIWLFSTVSCGQTQTDGKLL